MDLETIITEGWRQHHKDTEGVASRLVEAAGGVAGGEVASKYVAIVSHVLGQHLGRWDEAAELISGALERAGEGDLPLLARLRSAVARYLAGDVADALATEVAVANTSGAPLATMVALRLLVVEAKIERERDEETLALLEAALEAAAGLTQESYADKVIAMSCNNTASALLEIERTPVETALMRRSAEVAAARWARCGTWVNAERAEYLRALVYNAAGDFEAARGAAAKGLGLIEDNGGGEEVDQAFLALTEARALAGLGDSAAAAASFEGAEALAASFEGAGLRAWFEEEAAKVRAAIG